MQWRALTDDEMRSLPEARLGGALLWMIVAAGALSIVTLAGTLLDFARLQSVGARYMLAVVFLAAWSAAFIFMTMARVRSTPTWTSAALLAWIAYRAGAALLTGAGWPLLVDLLGEAVLAAGFCGYMAGGRRPNAYYRRRLPTD